MSRLTQRTHRFLERITGTRIYRFPPHGWDIFRDIENRLPKCRIEVVFDVGANEGQSAERFLAGFPQAKIYCFEPVKETFRKLQENVKSGRVCCFQIALGPAKGTGEMVLQGTADNYFLKTFSREEPTNHLSAMEAVDIDTLDDFCGMRKIPRIDYLKIDTEGADLEVLRGAKDMLDRQRIALVEVEAGMNRMNKRHVPMEVLKEYLELKQYFLFGVYEQMPEWPAKEPHLRRANLVFVSQDAIRANRL